MGLASKLLNKYKGISIIARASFWFMFCGILQKCVSLITTPIFTRMLSTAEYGEFSVYLSWLNLFSILTTLRLDYAVFNKGMATYPEDRDRYTSSMQFATSVITFIIFIVYLIFRNAINAMTELNTFVMCIMFIELLFMPATSFWMLRQRYEYRYKIVVFVSVLSTVLNALLGIVAISLTDTDKGEARIISCVVVTAGIGAVIYLINLIGGKASFNLSYVKFAVKFNIPLIPYYFSGFLLQQSNRIMIQKMSGMTAAAIYSVAYTVGLLLTLVSNSINSALAPWEYERLRTKEYQKIPPKISPILILIAALLFVFMAFAPEAVYIIAGEQYADAVYIIPAISSSVLFMMISDMFSNIEFYHDKNKFATVVSIFIGVANVLLNLVGISLFGYQAAGYTTMICYLSASMAHYIYVQKLMKKTYGEKLFTNKLIPVLAVGMVATVVLMTVLYTTVVLRYAFILTLFIVAVLKRKQIIEIVKTLKR